MNNIMYRILIFVISMFFINISHSVADNEEWSNAKNTSLPSSGTNFEAFIWQYAKNGDNNSNINSQQLIYAPANGLLWCGRPTQYMFLNDKKIVGIYSAGGNLYLIASPSKIIEPNLRPEHIDLNKYRSKITVEWNFETTDDKIISLGNIIGDQYLQDIKLARPPHPVQINNIVYDNSNIILSMTSEIGIKIVLVLNKQLVPISATVDGKQVYPKTSNP